MHVLILHPSPAPADRLRDALRDADPTVSAVAATTPDDAAAALRDGAFDGVAAAVDPTDETGVELLRTVRETAPDLPQVLSPNIDADADADAAERLVARLDAAVGRRSVPPVGLIDAVPGIGCLVASDGAVRQWNERAAEVIDADGSTNVADLVVSDARDRLMRAVDEAIDTGRRVAEAPIETADGERVDHEWTLTRLDGDVAVVGLDVSEWRAVAAELRETQESLATLYETLSNRDLTVEERLVRLLELGCERLGVEFGFLTRISGDTQRVVESIGTHPSLQPGDECPLSEAYCRKTIRGEGLLGVHNAVAAGWESDPAYEAFGLGCYLGGKVLVDGNLYGTLCFADDDPKPAAFTDAERTFVELLIRWVSDELEQRAAREELERQNERLSEFASIVSHDLRNPLNVAKGQLDIARETGDPAHIDEAEDALDRMEGLVTDLLELARQGTVIESTGEVELGAVADAAWSNVATADAELIVEADGAVAADRDRLVQLLENLFRNAVEHGSTSSRTQSDDSVEHGSTDSRRAERAGDSVEHGSTSNRTQSDDSVEHAIDAGLTVRVGVDADGFYVEDTGPGIPPDERGAVFERGHSTGDGTGLGLTIVQAIADAHGWNLTLAESDAGGARFEFEGVDRPVHAR